MPEYDYVTGWSYSHDVELCTKQAMAAAVSKIDHALGDEAISHAVTVTPTDYHINQSATNMMPTNYVAMVTILVRKARITAAMARHLKREMAEQILTGEIGIQPPAPTTAGNPTPSTHGISLVTPLE